MLNSIINRRTLFLCLLATGVSCGDLRGPAVLPDGAAGDTDLGPSGDETSGDSDAPEVTDPSDLDDPVDTDVVDGADGGESGDSFESGDACGVETVTTCLLYTSPSPRDVEESRMPSSA